MLVASLLLVVAVIVLFYGAEFSLDASEKVGQKLGLSPLVIGMLLIGFGTSLPEFFVGHIAGIQGKAGIAVGSLVGSNIANMFLILGVSGMIASMNLNHPSLRNQLLVHLGLGCVLGFVLTRDILNVFTASPLIGLCGFYLYLLFLDFKKEKAAEETQEEKFNAPVVIIKLFAGFGMLYLGGELLVKAGTDLCTAIGISEYIVSAIFIAFGTSFPELVTSILAVVKKKDTDLIVGNIVGSNLFNCAFILGSLGIYEFKLSENFNFEIGALIFGATALCILSFINKALGKLVSLLFLGTYGMAVSYWLKLF